MLVILGITAAGLETLALIYNNDFFSILRLCLKNIAIGSITDWISAACNMVMAYSAYKAFILAKDYFSDFIKKDGYELIKKMQLELIPKYKENLNLSSLNLLDIEVPSYVAGGVGIFQDEDEVSNLPQILARDLKDLKNRLKESYQLEKEIRITLEKINIYGWEMLPQPKEQLIQALSIGNTLFINVHNIVIYLSEILERDAPDFAHRLDKDFFDHFDPVTPQSPPCYQNIDVLVERVIKIQRKLINHQEDTLYTQTVTAIRKYFSNGRHLKNYYRHTNN